MAQNVDLLGAGRFGSRVRRRAKSFASRVRARRANAAGRVPVPVPFVPFPVPMKKRRHPLAKMMKRGIVRRARIGVQTRARSKQPSQGITIRRKSTMSGDVDFDRLSADEIMYLLENTDQPELMGGKLRTWLKKKTKKAKAVVQKIQKKIAASKVGKAINRLPKPLRIAAGIALAPIAPTLATTALAVAPKAAAAKIARKVVAKKKAEFAKMTPEQRKAELAKRKKRLRIASLFIPGVAPIAAAVGVTKLTAKTAKKGVEAIQAKRQARVQQQQQRIEAKQAEAESTMPVSPTAVVPQAVKDQVENGETVTAAVQEPAEQKKSILPIAAVGAAALLPFLLGEL